MSRTELLPPAENRRLVFLHLPKTGGTTLHHHFSEHFAPEEICPERFSNLAEVPAEAMMRYRYFSGHFYFSDLRFIPGPLYIVTVLRDPVERVLSTYYFWKRHRPEVIREQGLAGPAAARANDLAGFLDSTEPVVLDGISNTMARYLAGRINVRPDGEYRFVNAGRGIRISELEVMQRATTNLLGIDCIGFTSDLAEVYGRVAIAMGLPQIPKLERLNTREDVDEVLEPAGPAEEITKPMLDRLRQLTAMDREIYRLLRAQARESRR